LIFPDT